MPSKTATKRTTTPASSLLDDMFGDDERDGSVEEIVANWDGEALVYVMAYLLLEGAAVSLTVTRDRSAVGLTVMNGGKKPTKWFNTADDFTRFVLALGERFVDRYPPS